MSSRYRSGGIWPRLKQPFATDVFIISLFSDARVLLLLPLSPLFSLLTSSSSSSSFDLSLSVGKRDGPFSFRLLSFPLGDDLVCQFRLASTFGQFRSSTDRRRKTRLDTVASTPTRCRRDSTVVLMLTDRGKSNGMIDLFGEPVLVGFQS